MKRINKGIIIIATAFGIDRINRGIFRKYSGKLPSKYNEKYYNWDYGKIRYIAKGQGKPLLLIHGLSPGASIDQWETVISDFSKSHRVYALDLFGYGNSDKKGISYSSYMYARLINDFIGEIIKEPPSVITTGESCGFTLISTLFEPKNIDKLILISPCLKVKERKVLSKLIELPLIGTTLYNINTSRLFLRYYINSAGFKKAPKAIIKSCHLSAHNGGKESKYTLSAQLSGHFSLDIIRPLKAMDIPVQVIWGEENIISPTKNIRRIKRANRDIEIRVMEKTGLWPQLERPQAFVKICNNFLNR